MKHMIQTGLDFDSSKKVLQQAFEHHAIKYSQYSPSFMWQSNEIAKFGFKVNGIKLDGVILVSDDSLVLDMTVPFIARPFQGKAIEIIEKEVEIWVKRHKEENK